MPIDFLSPNDQWKVERALELVNAYAAGYIANAGLRGGINEATLLELFKNSYNFIERIKEKATKGELGK